MPSALSVAKELARLSLEGQEADPLTNLRLQKLLYYAQAWSMVVRGSDLFPEGLQAWRFGPVVPEVYHHCKAKEPEPKPASPKPTPKPIFLEDFEGIPDSSFEIREFLGKVWEAYKDYSASALYKKTHQEKPWVTAWGDRPLDASSREPIDPVVMGDFFFVQRKPTPISEAETTEIQAEAAAKKWLDERPPEDAKFLRSRVVARSGASNK